MMNTQTKAINGLKTISKRLVKKDPATGRREVKILWSTDLEIACDDSDDGAGNLMSWVRRVDSDWHGKEYDEEYETQERWKEAKAADQDSEGGWDRGRWGTAGA
jgi:hypothetical protein